MQFGERCHWLEAERTTHRYDPRWRTGVWLGRHSASDAHLIGTPGGVIQVRTVRRLTREQRGDDVSKRRREIFQVQNYLWKSRQLMVRSGLCANLEQALASADAGSRVRTAGEACKNSYTCFGEPQTFAMMLESDGSLETYTELNAVVLDLHEPDPETMWSSDLGWVPKSILQEAREKEVKKLQQFETYEEVPQAEAEGQEIISSRLSTNGKEVEN